MPEMKKRTGIGRRTIAPTADSVSPVMAAPGAMQISKPVSSTSVERERAVRQYYKDLEEEYGHGEYTRERLAEMHMSGIPDTPLTDIYTTQMRPKERLPGMSLEPLVITGEQVKREAIITSEIGRALELDVSLQEDVAEGVYQKELAEYHKQLSEYQRQQEEYQKQKREYEAYLAAEKDRERKQKEAASYLDKLGKELSAVETEARRAAEQQIPYSEYSKTLTAQKQRIFDIERTLKTSYGVTVPEAGQYLREITSIMQESPPAAVEEGKTPAGYTIKEGPLAGWTMTAYPDLDLSTDAIPPYREPIPQSPLEQILYHHKPIFDKIRKDTAIIPKPVAPKWGEAGIFDVMAYPVKSLIHDPIAPVYRPFEGALELAVGLTHMPKSVMHYATHPGEIPTLPKKFVGGLISQWDTAPHHLIIDSAVMTAGARVGLQAAKPITKPITAGLRETSIVLRTPAEFRPIAKGTSRIGRYTEGIYPSIQKAPDLSVARSIGDSADALKRVLDREPHVYYGSIIETGQMPRSFELARTGGKYTPTPSDVDVYVTDPARTAKTLAKEMGPGYSVEGRTVVLELRPGFTAHAVDLHAFPPDYPGGPAGIQQPIITPQTRVVKAPRLPFEPGPFDLLEAGGVKQEHLYTQLQKKARHVIGKPKGLLKWQVGPAPHRLKDVASVLIEADYLIAEGQKQAAQMPMGVKKLVLKRKIRKMGEGYDMLAGTELGKRALKTARGLEHPKGATVTAPAAPDIVYVAPGVGPTPAITGVGASATVIPAKGVASISPIASVAPATSPVVSVSPGVSPIVSKTPVVSVAPATSPVVSVTPGVKPVVTVSPGTPSPTIKRTPGAKPVVTVSSDIPSPVIKAPATPKPVVAVSPKGRPSRGRTAISVSPGIASPYAIDAPVSTIAPVVSKPPVSPRVIRPPTIRPPKRRRLREDEDKKRGKSFWDEWTIHYADAPTGHMGLRRAYLRLPDKPRRGPTLIKDLQRVTIGKAPTTTVKPTIKKGPSLKFGKGLKRLL